MKTKNPMVFFLAIVSALFLVATISAATSEIATIDSVKVNDLYDTLNEDISVIAGEMITIQIGFTALEDASDIRIKVELEGEKEDSEIRSDYFDVEEGMRYHKRLVLKVPYELKDEVNEDMALNIKIWNGDYKTEYPEITLKVQRPNYNVDVMAVSTYQTIDAGEMLPVDVVLKNTGYNYLDDVYATISIPALGLESTKYFGDLVAKECYDEDSYCDEDDEDTASKRFYLKIPYDAKAGLYALEVKVHNGDLTLSETKQVTVKNDLSSDVIVANSKKTFAVGEEAEYALMLVNPTGKLKVYRIVTESSSYLTSETDSAVIAVPAGGSRTIKVLVKADSQGEYDFDVNIFSGEELIETVTLTAKVEGTSFANPVIVLTIVLAVIFIVLLIVLIVLLGKKPEKTEEFGESYY